MDNSYLPLIIIIAFIPLWITLLEVFGIFDIIKRAISRRSRDSRKIEKDIEKLTKELKYDQEEEDTGNIR